MELFPAPDDAVWIHHTIVGSHAFVERFALGRCGNKVRHYLAAIHAPPAEQVMRHGIELIPTDFGGHKGVNSNAVQNLRQRPAISKYIR